MSGWYDQHVWVEVSLIMQTDTSATAIMVPLMSGTTRMSVDRDDVCSRLADETSLDDCTAQTGQYTIG